MAKRVVAKIKKQKGKFYYVDKRGNVIEADRSDMIKRKKSKKEKKVI